MERGQGYFAPNLWYNRRRTKHWGTLSDRTAFSFSGQHFLESLDVS